jgi:hypothetical protein
MLACELDLAGVRATVLEKLPSAPRGYPPLLEVLGYVFRHAADAVEVDLIARAGRRGAPRLHGVDGGDQLVLAQPTVVGDAPPLEIANRHVVMVARFGHRWPPGNPG